MAQFDVHRSLGPQKARVPFFVTVQSRRFDALARRVVVPLVLESEVPVVDTHLNPRFEIAGTRVVLDPLLIASVPADRLGERVGALSSEGDRVIAAIDLVISRAWG